MDRPGWAASLRRVLRIGGHPPALDSGPSSPYRPDPVFGTRKERIAWLVAVAVLLVAAAFSLARFRVSTSITHFLVSSEDVRFGRVLHAMADSQLSRTMVISIGAEDLDTAIASGDALVERLEQHPEVASIRNRVDPEVEDAVYDLYFPRRFMFASDRPDEELPRMLSDSGLQQMAEDLRRALSSPMAPFLKQIAPADPWLFFRDRLRALEQARMDTLELVEGRFVTAEHTHAIVFLTTEHSPFASEHQRPLQSVLEEAFAEIAAEHGGVEFERSSVHRLALASENTIRTDIQRISTISLVGVVALFLLMYRSVRLLLLSLIPLASGIVVATAVGLMVFGELHGLTFAFGSTLIGVCIDYPVHYFTHHTLVPHHGGSRGTMARVWPGILLGASTTVAGFLGLAWASFPGIREIGVFSSVGVAAALLATRILLPPLVPSAPGGSRVLRGLAAGIGKLLDRMQHRRGRLVVIPLLAAILCALGLPQMQWIDDAHALNRLEPAALQEDERVRKRVSRLDTGRFVLAVGETEQQALQRNDRVFTGLHRGKAASIESLHPFLWSAELQNRSLARFERRPDLFERVLDALQQAGFRPEPFEQLGRALRGPPPEPLQFRDLQDSPLAPAIRPFRIDLGREVGIISYLREVHDPSLLHHHVQQIDGVYDFDQRAFLADTYRRYRERVQWLVLLGLGGVALLLLVRYRRAGSVIAAFLPAILAAATTLAILSLAGVRLHLLHLVGVLLVLSIGVDYGVFLAETHRRKEVEATVLGLMIACGSTVLGFGLLALSSNPAMEAVGATTGIGVLSSLLLAPTTLILARGGRGGGEQR